MTKRMTVNSIASDTATLAEIFDRQLDHIENLSTRAVARLAGAIRPLETVMTDFRKEARTVLVERWQKGDKTFVTTDKNHAVVFKGQEVVVQEREGMVEKEGALKWLKENKPELYGQCTTQIVTVVDPEALIQARTFFHKLTLKLRRVKTDNPKLVMAASSLWGAIQIHDVLHRPTVEALVADKQITVKQLNKLYEIDTKYALVVNELDDEKEKT